MRVVNMLAGVKAYQSCPIEREDSPHAILWRKANARLLDYGGERDAPALLCVPSLINRHTIFDLYTERSFVSYMKAQGFRVCVLDWDTPGTRERRYGMGEYVDYLLLDALAALRARHSGELHLLGYCMGGLFTLAAAQLRPDHVDSLSLLATPWERAKEPPLNPEAWEKFDTQLRQMDSVPPIVTQTLFHLADPWHFQSKFARYASMSKTEQAHFAHVENWVNDGVPLSRYVARECYIEWPRANYFASGHWQVRGQVIDPSRLECPVFIAAPQNDRIVPPESSEPLASLIPHAQCLIPETGHVSMLVGRQAKKQLWHPLAEWLDS